MRTALASAVLLSACSTTKELVVLLPGEDGQVGAVAIAEPQRTTLLDTPLGRQKSIHRAASRRARSARKRSNGPSQRPWPHSPPSAQLYPLFRKEYRIMPDSRAILDALLAEVAKRQAVEVQITGHTDRVGKVEDNDRLSMERAEAIRDVLIKMACT